MGLGIAVGHVRLIGVHDFDSFGRREELDLTQELSLGAWAAPRAWGYAGGHDGIGPEVKARVSTVWHGGFAVLGGEAHGVYRSGGLDSGLVKGNVTIAGLLLSPRQTTVLHVEAGALRHPVPGGEFDLWRDGVGPRLFGVHSFTGTRTVWGFVEQRIPLSEDWMDLIGVGIAPFVDYGGAWYRAYGSAVIADERARLGGDVGLSLRVGPTRAIRGDVSELAVGYRFGAGTTGKRWAITLRRAITFQ